MFLNMLTFVWFKYQSSQKQQNWQTFKTKFFLCIYFRISFIFSKTNLPCFCCEEEDHTSPLLFFFVLASPLLQNFSKLMQGSDANIFFFWRKIKCQFFCKHYFTLRKSCSYTHPPTHTNRGSTANFLWVTGCFV